MTTKEKNNILASASEVIKANAAIADFDKFREKDGFLRVHPASVVEIRNELTAVANSLQNIALSGGR